MTQSKRMSLVESLTNVAVGIGVAWGATFLVFPWFGYEADVQTSLGISLIFTGISLFRSYVLRRCFNYVEGRKF
tara:strand:- start:1561 stop:1782 length:222 start_codon:yes stop_codon:yes gene_type:complete